MSQPTATHRFRTQHSEIADIVSKIETLLASADWSPRAGEIRQGFSELSAKLRIHLALEDDVLYPRLARHGESSVRDLAVRYQTEMGGIREAYEDFLKQWVHSGKLLTDPTGFKAATIGLFSALKDRIHRENTEVYTLVDNVGW
ncbi:MAG: hemerythrin domain-containing protein [Elstera sp.]